MINLKDKKVLLTGSHGFFGKHTKKVLESRGAKIIGCRRKDWDLTNPDDVYYLLNDHKPNYVIHLAANTGGIVYNRNHPADLFYDNINISTNLLKACQEYKVEKVVNVTTSCSYPDGLEILAENDYWKGRPNPSVEFFGIAKRASECFGRALNKQYGLNVVTACITNLYGPHDNFTENGKVVSNLIRKFVTVKQQNLKQVTCLGSGQPRRELMYVEDAAEGITRVLERYEFPELPINIGTGNDVSIASLALMIKGIVGYEGDVIWDTSVGDGQMKKLLDVSRMKSRIGYEAETPLDVGLEKTINWYIDNKEMADAGR